jgi:urease accessory protein
VLEIKSKLKTARHAYKVAVKGKISLPFEARRSGRLTARLDSGDEVALALPGGELLRGGDLLVASDGRVIEVIAEAEDLWHVECASPLQLARVAYLLGERHVPVQVGEAFLRLAADPALEATLEAVASRLSRVRGPFEPDLGAAPVPHEHAHGHDHPHHHHHHERHHK